MQTTHSTTIIPKPRYAASNLRKAMKLESDPTGYKTMTESLRELARKTLDLRKPWHEQQPMPKARYLGKAVKSAPILERYEKAWPAEIYARQHLCATSRRPITSRSRSTTLKGSPKPSLKRRDSLPAAGPSLTNTEPPAAVDDSTLLSALQALSPPMGHIAGLLEQSGLATHADLTAFAGWRETDQRLFLEKDVGIKPFQAKQFMIALNLPH